MKKGYVQSVDSAVEFQQIIQSMNEVGVDINNVVINQNLNEFIATLNSGDIIVVKNLGIFNNLSELLTKTIALLKQNIVIESITEPWFTVTQNQVDFLQGINEIEYKLRRIRTQQGLNKARANGKKLGRPLGSTKFNNKIEEVNKLRQTEGLSIARACEKVGCQPRTYYRHLREMS